MNSYAWGELSGAIAAVRKAYVEIAPPPEQVPTQVLVDPQPALVPVQKLVEPQPEGATEPVYETVMEPPTEPVYETVMVEGIDPIIARLDTALEDYSIHLKTR